MAYDQQQDTSKCLAVWEENPIVVLQNVFYVKIACYISFWVILES